MEKIIFAHILYQGKNFKNTAIRISVLANLLSALRGKSETLYLYELEGKFFIFKPLSNENELSKAIVEKSPIKPLSDFPGWEKAFAFTSTIPIIHN